MRDKERKIHRKQLSGLLTYLVTFHPTQDFFAVFRSCSSSFEEVENNNFLSFEDCKVVEDRQAIMDPMSSILNYEADPNEDYYGLLGCDASASTEQIIAEYKARAKDCHPDRKNQNAAAAPGPASSPQLQSREKFQHLLRVSHAYVRDATVSSSQASPRVIESFLKREGGYMEESQTRCLLVILVYKPNQTSTALHFPNNPIPT